MTKKHRYVARPVDPRTNEERLGADGVLVGEYVRYENMLRHMVHARGRVGTLYNVYVLSDVGTWTLTDRVRCYRSADILPAWLGKPI